jgi:hypothetical protein
MPWPKAPLASSGFSRLSSVLAFSCSAKADRVARNTAAKYRRSALPGSAVAVVRHPEQARGLAKRYAAPELFLRREEPLLPPKRSTQVGRLTITGRSQQTVGEHATGDAKNINGLRTHPPGIVEVQSKKNADHEPDQENTPKGHDAYKRYDKDADKYGCGAFGITRHRLRGRFRSFIHIRIP